MVYTPRKALAGISRNTTKDDRKVRKIDSFVVISHRVTLWHGPVQRGEVGNLCSDMTNFLYIHIQHYYERQDSHQNTIKKAYFFRTRPISNASLTFIKARRKHGGDHKQKINMTCCHSLHMYPQKSFHTLSQLHSHNLAFFSSFQKKKGPICTKKNLN